MIIRRIYISIMNSDNHLFVSLYYPQIGWHSLIKAVVIPYAGRLEEDFGRNCCILHLSYLRGENVGLTCRLPAGAIREYGRLLKAQSTDFFSNNRLGRRENKNYGAVFFQDFPVHSVKFNLHRFPLDWSDKIREKFLFPLATVLELVSGNISGILSEDEIDSLSVITFSFYLQVIAIKYFSRYLSDINEFFRYAASMMRNGGLRSPDDDRFAKIYLGIYEENSEVLTQIIDEIFNGAGAWPTGWARAFAYLDRVESKSDFSTIYREYKCLMNVIYAQLGLDGRSMTGFLNVATRLEWKRPS